MSQPVPASRLLAVSSRVGRAALDLVATLILLPLTILLFGSEWVGVREYEPASAVLADAGAEDGARALVVATPELRHGFELTIRARAGDRVEVLAATADGDYELLWRVPAGRGTGPRERGERFDAPRAPIHGLRVGGIDGSPVEISRLRLRYRSIVFDHRYLIPLPWLAWLTLLAARGSRALKPHAERALGAGRRIDPWIAALVAVAVCFRIETDAPALALLLGIFLTFSVLARLVGRALRRAPLGAALYVTFLVGLFAYFVPWAVTGIVAHRVSRLHDFSVDHRLRPDGEEINRDGLRFRGDAESLSEDDFVILALGDSFTQGVGLAYRETYPYVLEAVLRSAPCEARVRVVNMGWTSASPLLALRLLRQVGADYRPDLVLYALDMTDFHDDLRYERQLRRAGDLELSEREVTLALARQVLSRVAFLARAVDRLADLRRAPRPKGGAGESELPADRFFVTAQSLDESRAAIERGTMRHLTRIRRHAVSELGADMALVVYPRAYQYSAEESPRNWEAHRYEPLGPFVREPFRYLEEVADELPYPVLSLLEVFEAADERPLFLDDDPHWSRAGARLAADAVAAWLGETGLVPCAVRPRAERIRRGASAKPRRREQRPRLGRGVGRERPGERAPQRASGGG